MIDLKQILLEQGWKQERESETAFFFNHAPWIAPKAYLHIVFKGASLPAVEDADEALHLPLSWRQSLAMQNGAMLFSGALNVYGAHTPGALLERKDIFNQLPHSVVTENVGWPVGFREKYVVIGGYGYDGTSIALDKTDESVTLLPRKQLTILNRWVDADAWIKEEVERLFKLFDLEGKILVSEEDTLPMRIN